MDGGVSQRAEWPPEKEAGCLADCGAGGVRVLLRRQPRQLLNIRDIDHRIGRDESVARGYDFVESVSADKLICSAASERRAFRCAGRDLGIGQIWRDAQSPYE